MAEAEASIGELRGEVARLAAATAAAPRGLQPLEHEVEDVRAAVAEVAARVDAASVAATTTRERSDGLEKEVRKLQSRAADARHLQRATEDAVREVATFVAELEERLPDADASTREAAAREAVGEEGGKAAAADVAKLAADLAAHAKVVERLRFAVAAQQAAADEAKAAAAAPQSALETGSTSRDAVEAALAALAQRVGLVESTTTSAAQDAKEAAAAAADAREAARRAEAAPPQPATPPQSTGSTDAAVAETAAAVAALQGDVTALRGEVAALAAARVPAQAEAASAAAPDPAALATRLGRLEEASTVLAGQQQQLSRQLKKQASDGSMPATPRVRCALPHKGSTVSRVTCVRARCAWVTCVSHREVGGLWRAGHRKRPSGGHVHGRARPRPRAARHQQAAAAHRGPRAGAPGAGGVQREAGRAAADAPRARPPGRAPPAPRRRRLLSAPHTSATQ